MNEDIGDKIVLPEEDLRDGRTGNSADEFENLMAELDGELKEYFKDRNCVHVDEFNENYAVLYDPETIKRMRKDASYSKSVGEIMRTWCHRIDPCEPINIYSNPEDKFGSILVTLPAFKARFKAISNPDSTGDMDALAGLLDPKKVNNGAMATYIIPKKAGTIRTLLNHQDKKELKDAIVMNVITRDKADAVLAEMHGTNKSADKAQDVDNTPDQAESDDAPESDSWDQPMESVDW